MKNVKRNVTAVAREENPTIQKVAIVKNEEAMVAGCFFSQHNALHGEDRNKSKKNGASGGHHYGDRGYDSCL